MEWEIVWKQLRGSLIGQKSKTEISSQEIGWEFLKDTQNLCNTVSLPIKYMQYVMSSKQAWILGESGIRC